MNTNDIDIQTFFSDNLTKLVVQEIYETISSKNFPREQVNIDFHIKEGKMVCSRPWNTQFVFDSDSLSNCNSVVDFLGFAGDPSNEDVIFFEKWRDGCSLQLEKIIDDNFRKNCLKIVFDMEELDVFPLDRIKVVDIDISQRPENDKVLVVRKDAPKGIHTPPVTSEIMKAYEDGIDIDQFINHRKENGDSKYKYVTSAEWRKHFYDITVSMMVDYTPRDTPKP